MSDVYVEEPVQEVYSPFWPLFILIFGFVLFTGYEAYTAYVQQVALATEFKQAQPTINAAQGAESKLFAVFQDLQQTATKDGYAAQIVKESHIQLKPNANGGTATTTDGTH